MSLDAPEFGPPEIRSYLRFFLSGWGDLNSRPSVPQTDALTKLRHSPLWSGHSTGEARREVPLDQVR